MSEHINRLENIQRQLLKEPPVHSEVNHTEDLKPAAVLIPLIENQWGFDLLLIRRSETMRQHRGQVAFPGGRQDPEDENETQTALREAFEEINLTPDQVRIIGYSSQIITNTNYLITPVVGLLKKNLSLKPNPIEIESIFQVPLSYFVDPGNLRVEVWKHEKWHRRLFFWRFEDKVIWGATAEMIVQFLKRLGFSSLFDNHPESESSQDYYMKAFTFPRWTE